jgi:MFS family permease
MVKQERGHLGLVFMIVFLDMVGFSIIFPLFPDMLVHYLAVEGDQSWIGAIVRWLDSLAPGEDFGRVTLFGGLLGSIYSLLQFVFAPIWGGISDRHGRRWTLILTLGGTIFSYALWIFAGSFGLLIAARIVGGIMAGNIATAAAVVADTTAPEDRAKGMGIIGMAIGLGFIMGPAIGGATYALFPMNSIEWQTGLALNPFSIPAVAATLIACMNLAWVLKGFQETHPVEARGKALPTRSLNPFAKLAELKAPGLPRTNLIYFVYLLAFSAMEFTLTFLAVDRLGFGPIDNTWMFVYIGLVIAVVQGGVVRRVAPRLGEKKVSMSGILIMIPGFLLISGTSTVGQLYVGLGLLAVGSALAMPCLSALVSHYAPPELQGLAQGTFRSMGALSRAIGPAIGGILYWKLGSEAPYLVGAALMLLPMVLILGLPTPAHRREAVPSSGH